LREPNITGITVNLTALESFSNILSNSQSTTSGVDDPAAFLEVTKSFLVQNALGLFVKRAVESEDIKLAQELLKIFYAASTDRFGGFGWKFGVIVV